MALSKNANLNMKKGADLVFVEKQIFINVKVNNEQGFI